MKINFFSAKLLWFFLPFFCVEIVTAQPNFSLEEVVVFKDQIINKSCEFLTLGNGFFYKSNEDKNYLSRDVCYYSNVTKKSTTLGGMKMNANYNHWIIFKNNLIFTADDGSNGLELWMSDGTKVGTKMLKDCNTSGKNVGSIPEKFTILNDKLYFFITNKITVNGKEIDSKELWSTDGTTIGTYKIKLVRSLSVWGDGKMIAFKNALYFEGADAEYGNQLWTSDGTADGTRMVKNDSLNSNKESRPGDFAVAGDHLFFSATSKNYHHNLFVSDGTDNGTHWLKDLNPEDKSGMKMKEFVDFKGKLYFINSIGIPPTISNQLWCSDGTAKGTERIQGFPPTQASEAIDLEYPSDLFVANDKLYFSNHRPLQGVTLWVITGTENEPWARWTPGKNDCELNPEQKDIFQNFRYFPPCSNGLYVMARKISESEFQIAKSEGSICGIDRVKNFTLDVDYPDHLSIDRLNLVGKYSIFSVSSYNKDYPNSTHYYSELWATDGTSDGTIKISPKRNEKEVDGIYSNISSNHSLIFDNSLFFVANFNGHNSLYRLTFK